MDVGVRSPVFERSKRMTLDTQTFKECSQRMQLQIDVVTVDTMEEVNLCDSPEHRPTPPPRRHRNKQPCQLVTDLDADFLRSPSSSSTSQNLSETLGEDEASSSSGLSGSPSSQEDPQEGTANPKQSKLKQIVLRIKSPRKLIVSLMTAIANNIQLVQQDNLR